MLQNIKNKQQTQPIQAPQNYQIPQPQHQQFSQHNYYSVSPTQSHRPQIFKQQPSRLGTFETSSVGGQRGLSSEEQMHKVMCLMREQIQISTNFYIKKMQALIQDQAKQICQLRNMLENNQKQIERKNGLIQKIKQTPKKKISIVSNQTNQLQSADRDKELNIKINQLQTRIEGLENNIREKSQIQEIINVKIEGCEKGMVKYLAAKLNSCTKKVDDFIIKKQKHFQKLIPQPNHCSNPNPNTNTPSMSQPHLYLQTKQNKLHKQLKQLRRQIQQIKNKEYKYDNYQVEKLKQQITNLNKSVYLLESKIILRGKNNNNNGNNNLNGGHHQNTKQWESEKIIKFDDVKRGSNKQIRSEKAIQYIQNPHMAYTTTNIRPKVSNPQYLTHSTNTLYLNSQPPGPPLSRNYSQQQIPSNPNPNNFQHPFPSTKISVQPLPAPLSLSKHPQHSPSSANVGKSKNSTEESMKKKKTPDLQKQFYEEDHQQNEEESECLSYDQSFCSEDYDQEEEHENQEQMMERLIKTIKMQKLNMPVLVEIDQTGCLKCVQTGMYLVDQNSDVFYLGEQQLTNFSKKGIIRVTH